MVDRRWFLGAGALGLAAMAWSTRRPAEAATAAPATVLIPAFVVGELRRGFSIGFSMYLPFIVIDLVVSATLMGLGMFMLSPSVVSLPCKLYLFIMVDGWSAICGTVASSFR